MKWKFMAFKSQKYYKPYFTKVFTDFNEMKRFSAKHSATEKPKNPEYCSTYKTLKV